MEKVRKAFDESPLGDNMFLMKSRRKSISWLESLKITIKASFVKEA